MRVMTTTTAGLIALSWTVTWSGPADAQRRDRERWNAPHEFRGGPAREYRRHRRSNTTGPDGLCQRDTGIPTSQLNLRNRCDAEEFWDRQNRGGRFR
jgi:hypothetical protein